MAQVSVDFSDVLRKMKPMHGVDNGPVTCNFTRDASHLFKEAGIPISRLHDTEYPFGSGEYVDIHCLFKNFDADENDPASYNFALTDLYLKAILDCDTKIIYRLGCSIEHQPIKLHIGPPKDFAKYARICEHVIRHYNEGWADGFHWDIRYWEIWNEPNHAEQDRKMWGGSAEDFAHFYDVMATHLKSCFPDLMIGGPAFSNPESPFVHRFFTELTKDGHHPPMDFYSWHGYIDSVEESVRRAHAADAVLKQYGYFGIESIYDEWNYVKSWKNMGQAFELIHNEVGMALNAAVMAEMQSTSCTAACYYDAQLKFAASWCGIFTTDDTNRTNGGPSVAKPLKPFWAFKAFNELYRLGAKDEEAMIGVEQKLRIASQVAFASDDARLYGVASRSWDGTQGGILLSSYADVDEGLTEKEVKLSLTGMEFAGKTATVYIADRDHDLEAVSEFPAGELTLTMIPYTVALIIIQ